MTAIFLCPLRNSQLAAEFANCCAEVTLPELLQRFSLPVSLGDVKKFDNVMIIVLNCLPHRINPNLAVLTVEGFLTCV